MFGDSCQLQWFQKEGYFLKWMNGSPRIALKWLPILSEWQHVTRRGLNPRREQQNKSCLYHSLPTSPLNTLLKMSLMSTARLTDVRFSKQGRISDANQLIPQPFRYSSSIGVVYLWACSSAPTFP